MDAFMYERDATGPKENYHREETKKLKKLEYIYIS